MNSKLYKDGLSFFEASRLVGFSDETAANLHDNASRIKGPIKSSANEVGIRYFVKNIQSVSHALANNVPLTSSAPGVVSSDLDFLSTDGESLGFYKILNVFSMSLLKPSRKAAVVATVRNEGPFILEWIAHHLAVGFDEFFIYTNENTDGSLSLLRVLDKAGVINLIVNEVGLAPNPQVKAYDHSLMFLHKLRDFEWVMFLDADEFLIPAQKYDFNIAKFIEIIPTELAGKKVGSVSFNWMWMGSDGAIRREQTRNVTDRFEVGEPRSLFVKSIVRPSQVLSMRSVHKPVLCPECVGVNSRLEMIDPAGHDIPHEFAGGEIRHYWNKSFEEFLVKQARGFDRDIWERDTDLFFDWDVPRREDTIRPFPNLMKRRKDAAFSDILKTNSVREAEAEINLSYSDLVKKVCNGVSIERISSVSVKTRKLNEVLQFKLDESIESALRMVDSVKKLR